MFNKEIKEKILEKLEYDVYFFKEYFNIYLKLFLFFYDSSKIRSEFTNFMKNYYQYSFLEYEILNQIKKAKENPKIIDICLDMQDDIETIFYHQFNYNEHILKEIEEAISMNDLNQVRILKPDFKMITKEEKEKFIKKLKINN